MIEIIIGSWASIKLLAVGCGRLCELTKILPDQINLGRKPFESLSRSNQVRIFSEHFQLAGGGVRGRGLKCSNRAFECVNRSLDHHGVARTACDTG